jgi:hypothetical protein
MVSLRRDETNQPTSLLIPEIPHQVSGYVAGPPGVGTPASTRNPHPGPLPVGEGVGVVPGDLSGGSLAAVASRAIVHQPVVEIRSA